MVTENVGVNRRSRSSNRKAVRRIFLTRVRPDLFLEIAAIHLLRLNPDTAFSPNYCAFPEPDERSRGKNAHVAGEK